MAKNIHVSGNIEVSQSYFDTYYVPQIMKHINDPNVAFFCGGAKGVDTMLQEFLISCLFDPKRVFVYDRRDEDHRVSKDFNHKNGFKSHTDRDEALTAATSEDIAICHQYGGGGSGTFQNVVRRKFGVAVARDVTALFRKHSCAYEEGAIKKLSS